MNQTVLRIVGVVAILGGGAALYASGVAESTAGALLGAVFVVSGIIAGIIKGKEPK